MTRETAIQLLFWFRERECWRKDHLQLNSFVWPPFPREDEFRDLRIKLYEHSNLNGRRCPDPKQQIAG